MKITLKTVGAPAVFQGTSKKTMKPYTITTYACTAIMADGAERQMPVKAYGDDAKLIVAGAELEVKEENYNGNVSYMVERPKGAGFVPRSGYGGAKNTMTREQFTDFAVWNVDVAFAVARKLCPGAKDLDLQNAAARLYDKIIGCASVMVKHE